MSDAPQPRSEGSVTSLSVTTLRERPDLLPIVAEWLWHQWWERLGRTLKQTEAIYAECIAEIGAPQTFILLEGDEPIGTVTMARRDLDERPHLTPWLAGVFVIPDRRGRGYIRLLFAEFEKACRAASVDTAWLFTSTAERVYLRAGWETVELIHRPGEKSVVLMRRAIRPEL